MSKYTLRYAGGGKEMPIYDDDEAKPVETDQLFMAETASRPLLFDVITVLFPNYSFTFAEFKEAALKALAEDETFPDAEIIKKQLDPKYLDDLTAAGFLAKNQEGKYYIRAAS